ncbi:hypothetical protein [Azospirillum sp. Marseille-Q6669]
MMDHSQNTCPANPSGGASVEYLMSRTVMGPDGERTIQETQAPVRDTPKCGYSDNATSPKMGNPNSWA